MSFADQLQAVHTLLCEHFNGISDVGIDSSGCVFLGTKSSGFFNIKEKYADTLTALPVVFNSVVGDMEISRCRVLNTLKGLPAIFSGNLTISSCPALETLDGLPSTVAGHLVLSDLNITQLPPLRRVEHLVLRNLPDLEQVLTLPESMDLLSIHDCPRIQRLDLSHKLSILDIQTLNIPLIALNCPNANIIQLGIGSKIEQPPADWFLHFAKKPQTLRYIVTDKTPVPWLDACNALANDRDILKYFSKLEEYGITPILPPEALAAVPDISM